LDVRVSGNTVTGNTNWTAGVWVRSVLLDFEMVNNVVSENDGDGIEVVGCPKLVLSNNTASGNGHSGVEISVVTSGRVVNLTSVNNGWFGVSIGSESSVEVSNSIVRGNTWGSLGNLESHLVTFSDIEGGHPGIGNIDADPLFVDPLNGDYRLSAGSPAIDAGDNTAVPEGVYTDLEGNHRFWDDPATPDTGFGEPPNVDMGAYEFPGVPFSRIFADGFELGNTEAWSVVVP
jgi:parallel beta-helix repeat protein